MGMTGKVMRRADIFPSVIAERQARARRAVAQRGNRSAEMRWTSINERFAGFRVRPERAEGDPRGQEE